MRAANAYQSLHDTHQKVDGDVTLPGRTYEPLRDTLRELDERQPPERQEGSTRPELARSIDTAEARRASLDRELGDLRAANRAPEQGATPQQPRSDDKAAIERALNLQDQPSAARSSTQARERAVPPRDWAHSGGMKEQQDAALQWARHSAEERARRATQGPATQPLSRADLDLLNAARAQEAQSNHQEPGRSRDHEYPGP